MDTQFKKGVLELVVLEVVDRQDIYGYELVKQVCAIVHVNEGTIYPLLKRLTNENYFITYLKESNTGPSRKYYQITLEGKQQLATMKKEWMEFATSINQFFQGGDVNE